MTKKRYMVGNWKMNHKKEEIDAFFKGLEGVDRNLACEAWIAPQTLHIPLLLERAAKTGKVQIGAQNVCNQVSGAYTGETSPEALTDLGASFSIIGHSERRSIYGETDKLLNEKTKLSLATGLTVIFCVGESLEERESEKTIDVVKGQIVEGLKGLSEAQMDKLLIAYEPVWAIGTGKVATPEQAQEVHAFIRLQMAEMFGAKGRAVPILYGGSVKPDNFAELLDCPDIEGGLVGGASLKPKDYSKLCQIADEKSR